MLFIYTLKLKYKLSKNVFRKIRDYENRFRQDFLNHMIIVNLTQVLNFNNNLNL